MRIINKSRGFTLVEILIALFIFTILSMLLVSALHNVINLQSGTEVHAERLRKLQMALLVMSRDIEQAVFRPVNNPANKEEPAFIGTAHRFTFTHAGYANPAGAIPRSTLQRTRYTWDGYALWRATWETLDQTSAAPTHSRQLLTDVTDARFQYLDNHGHLHNDWPISKDRQQQPLPQAVQILLTIANWGTLSQLYVISAQPGKTT